MRIMLVVIVLVNIVSFVSLAMLIKVMPAIAATIHVYVYVHMSTGCIVCFSVLVFVGLNGAVHVYITPEPFEAAKKMGETIDV